jgi:hypothetical protein
MCDYSLQNVTSRPAKVGDKLFTKNFGTGTAGFASVDNAKVCVCVLPGTELAFEEPVAVRALTWTGKVSYYNKVAIFRQINTYNPHTHHDALEFADGTQILLTRLAEDQYATVLQMPVATTPEEAKQIERIPIKG